MTGLLGNGDFESNTFDDVLLEMAFGKVEDIECSLFMSHDLEDFMS